ncbi:hypothetical protein [Amycolatopsis sp. NPDC051372]|uniref:hypothetical protein n=1 Tax=Amycolatopsis sp. NPDC051372 TaxID=3155669 RepID=UPI00341ED8A9
MRSVQTGRRVDLDEVPDGSARPELVRLAVVVAPAAVPHFPEFGFLAGRADELVLWRCGLPTAKFRMPAPVPAATCVSNSSFESLVALVEVDRELVVHIEGDQDTDLRKLHTPIDFRVAGEDRLDLSPLYLWRGRRVPRPVVRHYDLPWLAVRRSAHLIEGLDIATAVVLHHVETGS